MTLALRTAGIIGLGCLLSGVCMGGTARAQALHLDERGFLSTVDRGNRKEPFLVIARSLLEPWSAAGFRRGDPASDGEVPQPQSSLLGCLNSPASLLVCIEAGVVSLGKVAARYTGKGKDLVKLL